MLDSSDLDEKRSVGKIFILPETPWYNPNDPTRRRWCPDSTPFPKHLQDSADHDLARELADQMLATMPNDLHTAAAAAYQVSQQAAAALNAVEQEYARLHDSMPTELSVEERGAWLNRCEDLESYVAELRAANATARDAYIVALEAARRHVQLYSGCPVYDQEQATIRQIRAEAEQLEQAAAHRQIALSNAISLVNAWLPVE